MKKNLIKKTFISATLTATLFTSMGTLNQVIIHADGVNIEQTQNGNQSNSSLSSVSSMSSSASDQAIQKRELSKSYIVFGSGLSQSEQQQVASVLAGNADTSNFTDLIANANDYNQYINNGQPSDATNASMISSVAIEPADPGSGISVDIKKFDGQNNIQEVTQQQYAMAAQMAGVTDINIVVTANRPVSGTSALTGVYEALAQDGIKLNNQNTTAANQVLSATQQATKGMSPSQQTKVVQATGQTANQIAKDNQNGNPDSQQQIADMLKKNLDKQGVNISGNNVNIIANGLNQFKSTPAAKSKDFTKGMNNTLDNIKDSVNGDMIKAKDWADAHQGWLKRMWNKVKTWFNTNIRHKNPVQIQNSDNSNASSTGSDNDNTISSSNNQ